MSALDRTIIVISMALALNAGIQRRRAARLSPHPWHTVHATIAAFSFLYTAAYGVLLAWPHMVQEWSSVMRGVSMVVWYFVWAKPATMFIAQRKETLAVQAVADSEA